MLPAPRINQSLPVATTLMINFISQKSALLGVTDVSSASPITFEILPGTKRQTLKISNVGAKKAYIGSGVTSATAVVSTATPASNCDCIPAGAIITQDFEITDTQQFLTIAAICKSTETTDLEISIGAGQ